MMATSKSVRKRKIYSKFQGGGSRICDPQPKEVPWLNVSGIWLRKAGFEVGDQVEITIKPNELHIKKDGHGDQ